MIRAIDALRQTLAVDVERRRPDAQSAQLAALGHDRRSSGGGSLLARERRRGAHVDVWNRGAGHGLELVRSAEVGLDHAGENRDVALKLMPRQVRFPDRVTLRRDKTHTLRVA